MAQYQKMYTVMFNAISDALEEIDKLNVGRAQEILRDAQSRTEEIYVSREEEEDRS